MTIDRPDDHRSVSAPSGSGAGEDSPFRPSLPRVLDAQLRQSEKMEAVGRLAGGIAHHFNNLLMGLTGCTTLALSEMSPDDPARIYVREAKQAAERGAEMTRRLMAFSEREARQCAAANVHAALVASEAKLRALLGPQIELCLQLEAQAPQVRISHGELEQIVLNLVDNAREAMPGGGRLDIATSQQPRHVVLRVSDNGCGMDAGTCDRAFEPFFTTKDQAKGTGLGLSVVYGLVDRAGGKIHVDSEPDRGCSLSLYLPRAERCEP